MSFSKDSKQSLLFLHDTSKLLDKGSIDYHNKEITRITSLIDSHIAVYNMIQNKLDAINRKLYDEMTEISTNNTTAEISILEIINKQFDSIDSNTKQIISDLYKVNAFYEEFVNSNTSVGYYKLTMFPSFIEFYQMYKEGLILFKEKKQIEIVSNMEVLADQEIKTVRDKTIKIIEKVYTRMLFFDYSILHNHYLSIIYMMYAVRQFRLLNNAFILKGKRMDYIQVEKALSGLINGSNELNNDEIRKLLDNQANNLQKGIDIENKLKTISGGADNNSPTVSELQKLVDVFYQKQKKYMESNTNLQLFFDTINDTIKSKSEELLELYLKDNTILNENIRKPLLNILEDTGKYNSSYNKIPVQEKFNESIKEMFSKLNRNATGMFEELPNSSNMMIGNPSNETTIPTNSDPSSSRQMQ